MAAIPQKKVIQNLIQTGEHMAALYAMRDGLSESDDFLLLFQHLKLLRSLNPSNIKSLPIRVAVIGNTTLEHLAQALEARLFLEGFIPTIYFSQFGTLTQSVLDPASDLYLFHPDIIWIFSTFRETELAQGPIHSSREQGRNRVESAISRITALWDAIRSRCSAAIIQNNSDLPTINSLGNYSGMDHCGAIHLIREFNQALVSVVEQGTTIFDFQAASNFLGARAWADNRLWHHSKHAITLDASAFVARRLARLVSAIKGLSKKCIVLDLDNTLWGGVIGDDGVEGIQLGSTPSGEAYMEFQEYLKQLKDRGILLAVCSKNEEDAAKSPFLLHPDMKLKLEDISVFVANWNNKADNIRGIAERLNLGLDSFIFVDDNPAERDLVRNRLPMVCVIELSPDPAEYIANIESCGYFETISISAEDLSRAKMYSENSIRQELRQQITNIDDYLRDLQMECIVGHINPFHVTRMAQLMHKSNQFNLTGIRYTEADFEAAQSDPSVHVRNFILKDRFGDNGLISVVVLQKVKDDLHIISWVMSCRVLERGMEEFIMGEIQILATQLGAKRILGRFVKSSKNALVERLYEKLSFSCLDKSSTDSTWEYSYTKSFPTFITKNRETHDFK